MKIFLKNKKGPVRNASSIADAGGFTLIELLVVVAIISLLSSIIFASLSSARVKARDARRYQDLHSLSIAIRLYMMDNNNNAPPDTCATDASNGGSWGNCTDNTGDWNVDSGLRVLVTGGYISSLPKDPVNNSTYNYNYEPGNQNPSNACLSVLLEGKANTLIGVLIGDPVDTSVTGYTAAPFTYPPIGYQCGYNPATGWLFQAVN